MVGRAKIKQRQAAIDAARLLGYDIRPSPGVARGEYRYAVLRPDGKWVSDKPLTVATFKFMWAAALFALEQEGVDVSVFVTGRDARAGTGRMYETGRRGADRDHVTDALAYTVSAFKGRT